MAGELFNSFEPVWPKTLTGFAKRAHEFWQKELEPHGYKLRAQMTGLSRRHAGRRGGCSSAGDPRERRTGADPP